MEIRSKQGAVSGERLAVSGEQGAVSSRKAAVNWGRGKVKAGWRRLDEGFPVVLLCLCLAAAGFPVRAQSGGGFEISQSVIASGGGMNSAGGGFRVDGTAGQAAAGTISTGGGFSVRGGFWAFDAVAPTAAGVSVAGRVLTISGQGIRNASVILTDETGTRRSAQTGTFGYFRFEEITVGRTYILEVVSKRYVFANPTRILSVQEEVTGADFTAEPE